MLAPSCESAPLVDFAAWLLMHNATLSPKLEVRCTAFGRGIFVRRDDSAIGMGVRAGEELAAIPLQLLMTLAHAEREPALAEAGASGASSTDRIALFLLHQRRTPSASWHPYASALPREVHTTLAWSPAELDELQASELRVHAAHRARAVDRQWHALPRTLRGTPGEWAWALTQVWSRGHRIHGVGAALCPLIDMFNNGLRPNVGPARVEDELLVLRAALPIPAGDEATVPYGDGVASLPNARLLMDYGFCVDDPAGQRDTAALPLRPPPFWQEQQPERYAQLLRLRLLDMPPPQLTRASGSFLPPELVVYARLATVEPEAKVAEEAASVKEDVDAFVRRSLTMPDVRRYIHAQIRSRLDEYNTSASEDVQLLLALDVQGKREATSSPEWTRRRCALSLRKGEKEILQHWLHALAEGKDELR